MNENYDVLGVQIPQEKQRLVVFVGGFDPRGARYYHQLMRVQAEKQENVSKNKEYKIGRRTKTTSDFCDEGVHSQWTVEEKNNSESSGSDMIFFDWHDEVKSNWPSKREKIFLQAVGTYSSIWQLRKWLKPIHKQAQYTLWALMYPLVYTFLVFSLGILFAIILNTGLERSSAIGAAFMTFLGIAFSFWLGLLLDKYIHVSWLLRILNFAHLSSTKKFPVLDKRIDAMAEHLAKGLQHARWREVVIVGFSVGSVQAVKLTAALRRKLDAEKVHGNDEFSLVTLGNCIPLFGLFPGAKDFRRDLRAVAEDRKLYWADISSPSDSVCFGMCDVVGLSLREDGKSPADVSASSRVGGSKAAQWGFNPQAMCSPRFHKLFLPETYRWLRRNKMRMHFQYLMAGEIAGAYDFYELLTTPGSVRSYIEKKLVR